jgi:L-methionine (R)-S-oxide reductase
MWISFPAISLAVLDADSEALDQFDETDAKYLEQIVKLVNFK